MNAGDPKGRNGWSWGERAVGWSQGVYFGATGLWPILHLPSFLFVTGPKIDTWLVQFWAICRSPARDSKGAGRKPTVRMNSR